MSANQKISTNKGKQNKIFISWSGAASKEIAKNIKNILENVVFANTGLTCFVSDVDIASGVDWWNKIKDELMECKLGILCITKENVKAPWIYFEAGTMVARDVPTIPLLINCSVNSLEDSPLKGKQCVDFYDQQQFIKMIADVNLKIPLLSKQQIDAISNNGYEQLKRKITPILKKLKNMRVLNERCIYPPNIMTVKVNSVYISAPMASIDESSYSELRKYLLTLKEELKSIGFVDVRCPIFEKETQSAFSGKIKAIRSNFVDLKQVDSMIIIYPQKCSSSVLVELGYGIALSKRLVIFHKEGLPYMLEEAGGTIKHVKIYNFTDFSDITEKIKSNGMHIFEEGNDV